MTRLDPKLRTLVEAGRRDRPSPGDHARIRALLTARLSAVPAPHGRASHAPSSAPAPASVAAPWGTVPLAKFVVALAIVGTGAFVGGYLTGSTQAATPHDDAARSTVLSAVARDTSARDLERRGTPAEAPSMASAAAPPEAGVGTAAAAPRTSSPTALRRVTEASPSVPSAAPSVERLGTLGAELEILRRAQEALRADDGERSLALLDELHARYPDGLLREEQAAGRVLALCAAGRPSEARSEAQRFLATWPRSLHAERVRGVCASSAPPEEK